MTYNRKFLFSLLALGFLLSCTQTPEQRAENATVLIVVGNTDSRIGTGSGFFVERDKIATNIHVVDSGMVFAVGRKKVYNIEAVTGYDSDRDLVVLKVSGKGTPLELSEGQIDDPIYVVGYPGGGYKVTKGKVHGIRESDGQLRLVPPDFPANRGDSVTVSGNSGGPVLNNKWQVIGIAVSSTETFSCAIASSAFNDLLDSSNKEKLADWQKKDPIRSYVYAAWGREKLKNGNYELAIKGLNRAALYPRATVYNDLGTAKTESEEHQEAIKYFSKAIGLIPDYAGAYKNRGNAKLKSKNHAGAIQDYNKTLELNPDYADAYNNRGVAKLKNGDYEGAIQDYTQVIKLKKDDAGAYNNRGFAKIKSEDYTGAIQDYTKAIELKKDYAMAYNRRGVAKRESGDHEGAIQDYTKAIELKKDYAAAYYNRGNAKKARGKVRDAELDHARFYYYWGKTNSNRGNYQEAIKNFDKSIEFNSDYATYYARGEAKRAIKKHEEAIHDYTEAINRKPDYTEAYYDLGRTHLDLDKYTKARDYFIKVCTILEETINRKPDLAEAYYYLGITLHRLDKYKEAVDRFSNAIRLKEPVIYAKAYKARGHVQEDLGNEAEAKVDYAMAHCAWGREALKRAEYSEAIKHFNAILELDPERAHVRDARGTAKMELGRSKAALGDLESAQNLYQEAIEDYDKAIDLESENSRFYHNRGLTKLLRGAVSNHNDYNGRIEDYQAAIEDLTEAIKRKSNLAAVHPLRGMARCLLGYTKANQGRSKEARGQYKEALKDFKEAINLDPNNASYHEGLGLANAALGKAKATLEAFEEAKKRKEETEKGK